MKTKNVWKWTLGGSLALVYFLGCGPKAMTNTAAETVPAVALAREDVAEPGGDTNAPPPEVVEQSLENASAQVVAPAQPPTNTLSAAAAEIVKLAQAGVDENVMMTYVTNSAHVFNLSSDDIVYLNDVGVPSSVVTAMLQRDQNVKGTSTSPRVASAPPVYTNQLVPAPGAPTPYATAPQVTDAQPQSETVIENVPPASSANVSYTYFYNTLSPYGSWVNVEGYGMCWQPTVVVVNHDWQPYCDRGHWVYSDSGWYWVSDYSWGWAPFHYGRWFRHSRIGWCWAPDTVWGPSWVSWRYSNDYCGWAPLPPAACYRPGIGFTYYGHSVGVSFSFGLTPRHYAFVPARNFYDRHPGHYRLPERNVVNIYNNTTIIQRYDRGDRDRVINRGIPVEHIRSATHTDIRPVAIHETDRPQTGRTRGEHERGQTLDVFRPPLPQPEGRTRLVGEGVHPATRQNPVVRQPTTRNANPPVSSGSPAPSSDSLAPRTRDGGRSGNHDRQNNSTPVIRTAPLTPVQPQTQPSTPAAQNNSPAPNPVQNSGTTSTPHGHDPVIIRGPGRSASPDNSQTPATPRTWTSPTSRSSAAPHTREITPAPTPVAPTPSVQPTPSTPAQINPSPSVPSRQFTPTAPTRIPPAQSEAPRQNSRIVHHEAPVVVRPPSDFSQPAIPREGLIPRNQIPHATEITPQYSSRDSIERRSARIESPRMESASRPETRQNPVTVTPIAPGQGLSPADGNGRPDGQDRQDRGNASRRNR